MPPHQQRYTIFDYFHDPFLLVILTVNPVFKKQIMGWLLKERLVAYNRQLPNYNEAFRLVMSIQKNSEDQLKIMENAIEQVKQLVRATNSRNKINCLC